MIGLIYMGSVEIELKFRLFIGDALPYQLFQVTSYWKSALLHESVLLRQFFVVAPSHVEAN